MLQHILSSRVVLASLIFCVLIVGSSLFYHWHIRRTTDAELAQSEALLQQRENQNETYTTQDTVDTGAIDFEHAATLMETDETDGSSSDDAAPIDLSDAFLPDDFLSEEEQVFKDTPASPFGYGPYPEVPFDYFGEPIWVREPYILSDFPDEARRNIELIDRVLVKLWQQGDRGIVGGSTYDGKVYPHYDDVVYVRWKETELPDGSVLSSFSQIGGYKGPELTSEAFRTGNIPTNLEVIDIDDAGFDPYQFLNLRDNGY
ncbi:hypothetical protein F4X88_05570 [Candidatus Poribacteria bacterium]|nr:hypothetical protein [Candidatus Poribacteria bacterium]MYA55744.1 hypothetical protein [Candidatus Poribacteria bacterium]